MGGGEGVGILVMMLWGMGVCGLVWADGMLIILLWKVYLYIYFFNDLLIY